MAVAWAEVLAGVGVEDKEGGANSLIAEGTKEISDRLESKKKKSLLAYQHWRIGRRSGMLHGDLDVCIQ